MATLMIKFDDKADRDDFIKWLEEQIPSWLSARKKDEQLSATIKSEIGMIKVERTS